MNIRRTHLPKQRGKEERKKEREGRGEKEEELMFLTFKHKTKIIRILVSFLSLFSCFSSPQMAPGIYVKAWRVGIGGAGTGTCFLRTSSKSFSHFFTTVYLFALLIVCVLEWSWRPQSKSALVIDPVLKLSSHNLCSHLHVVCNTTLPFPS